jgi:hypothetical protein
MSSSSLAGRNARGGIIRGTFYEVVAGVSECFEHAI